MNAATREALLRAAIIDTPWSAAFISYLMKTAGFSSAEFVFSDSHADYVRAALEVTAAEAAGREATHAEGGDAKIDTIGGNVFNSVTLSRMTLNAKKVLGDAYLASPARREDCAPGQACRGHLSRRPWLVLLQFRG